MGTKVTCPITRVCWARARWHPWHTTSANTAEVVCQRTRYRGLCRCFLQIHGMREEDRQATCGETHWESTCWKVVARHRSRMRRTSRWHLYMYLLIVRSPVVSSLFNATTPWSKSSSLLCMLDTTEFVLPTESKFMFGIPWKNSFCDGYFEQSNSNQQLHICSPTVLFRSNPCARCRSN